jgi:hypothetical protein
MRIILALLFLWTITSCKSGKDTESTWNALLHPGCYTFSGDGSTISFEITEAGNQVQGNLVYDIVGKGMNSGTFEGTLQDNLLVGTYTFRTEGTERTREVAFRIDQDELREGNGILDNEGKAFRSVAALNFSNSRPLKRANCYAPALAGDANSGELYSQVQLALFNPDRDGIMLKGLSGSNSKNSGSAHLVFSPDGSRAEIFFPGQHRSLVLRKTHEGNWSNPPYTLSSWKGYTLHHQTTPIYSSKQTERVMDERISEAR